MLFFLSTYYKCHLSIFLHIHTKINLITFQTWKNSVVKKLRGGIELLCKNYNVDIYTTKRVKA